ncbi:MAG: MraY family glycosyltransferase [Azovibrio sp.]
MRNLLISFSVSFISTLLIIRFNHFYGHISNDYDVAGVQKFHTHPVPRIGGVGIVLALLSVGLWLYFQRPEIGHSFLLLLLVSMPAFAGGLAEDLTKRAGIMVRLLLTMMSALLGYWLLGAVLSRLSIPGIDYLLSYTIFALAFTAITVAGVANAINIIDGFNGLAGMVSLMILGALGYIAFLVGDTLLWNVCLATMGGIVGFFVWNYPRGMIFLGDGGAYLVGFLIGEISVLLVARHPEVSPWFPFLLVIYPVFETLFSIYRKKVLRGTSPGMPDGLHLHMLVFKRLVRWATGNTSLTKRNAATSPYLWLLCSTSVIPAVLFWDNTLILMLFSLTFAIGYVWLYRRIVLFRSPRMLSRRRP